MLSQFGAVAYRRVPLRPFFVGETPPDRREAILVVLSGSKIAGQRPFLHVATGENMLLLQTTFRYVICG